MMFVLCRAVVVVARRNERVYNFVGREMLRGSMAALAHPIFTAAETLQLIRDILAQQLATSPGPRQVGLPIRLSVCSLWSVCLSVCLSVCTCGQGQDITERGGVQWAQQTCLLPVCSNALLPSMPVCLCHQNWTLLPRPHQLSHVVCRSC